MAMSMDWSTSLHFWLSLWRKQFNMMLVTRTLGTWSAGNILYPTHAASWVKATRTITARPRKLTWSVPSILTCLSQVSRMRSGMALQVQCFAAPRRTTSHSVASGITSTSATRDGPIHQSLVVITKAKRQDDMTNRWLMPIQRVEPTWKDAAGGVGAWFKQVVSAILASWTIT